MFKEPLEDGSGERLVYDFDGTGKPMSFAAGTASEIHADPQADSSVNWLVSPVRDYPAVLWSKSDSTLTDDVEDVS